VMRPAVGYMGYFASTISGANAPWILAPYFPLSSPTTCATQTHPPLRATLVKLSPNVLSPCSDCGQKPRS
jgi:hypothetical protein